LKLRQRGLADELIEACLSEYPAWLGHLEEVRRKKFGAGAPASLLERHRQMRFLAYRGFTSAQVRTALGIDTDIDLDE
jgi:regulatory protein